MTIEDRFKYTYGDKEVEIKENIITIRDDFLNSHSSGSNGYFTKARVNEGKLELYHDWLDYGWMSYEEAKEKYPYAVSKVLKALNLK